MTTDHEEAMDELRRVCSGDRDPGRGLGTTTVDVVPPPSPCLPAVDPLGSRPRNPIGKPDNDTGRGHRPRQSVGRDGGSVGGGGHTHNGNARSPIGTPNNDPWRAGGASSINWAYIAIVVYTAAMAGALVYVWSHR